MSEHGRTCQNMAEHVRTPFPQLRAMAPYRPVYHIGSFCRDAHRFAARIPSAWVLGSSEVSHQEVTAAMCSYLLKCVAVGCHHLSWKQCHRRDLGAKERSDITCPVQARLCILFPSRGRAFHQEWVLLLPAPRVNSLASF